MKNMKDSPSIPQRVLVEQESGSEVLVSTPAWLALARKAGKNDVPLSILEQVYARGVVTAEPHPKNTPEQQAFHRVESFIHEGQAYELDKDLTEMCPVPDGSKHMDVIKNAIKNHKARIKSQQVNEGIIGNILGTSRRRKKVGGILGAVRSISGQSGRSSGGPSRGSSRSSEFDPDEYREKKAQRTQADIEGKAEGKARAAVTALGKASRANQAASFEKEHPEYKVNPETDDAKTGFISKRLQHVNWRIKNAIVQKGEGIAKKLGAAPGSMKVNISLPQAQYLKKRSGGTLSSASAGEPPKGWEDDPAYSHVKGNKINQRKPKR